MDELILSGKKYISSKRAQEITGYAKDYVGQLVRSGKIPATRVGRAWYVDEESLKNYEATGKAIVVTETPLQAPTLEIMDQSPEVRELLKLPRTKTIASIKHLSQRSARALPRTWNSTRYSQEVTSIPLASSEIKSGLSTIVMRRENISDRRDYKNIRVKILKDKLELHGSTVSATFDLPRISPGLAIKKEDRRLETLKMVQRESSKINSLYIPFSERSGTHAFALVALAIVVLVFFSSGLFVSSHLVITPRNSAYSANAYVSYQYFRDTIQSAPFIQSGIQSLTGFFGYLAHSSGDLVSRAIAFLSNLPNLVSTR